MGSNFQNAFYQPCGLGRVERRLAAEVFFQLFLSFVRMPHFGMRPKIGGQFALYITKISLSCNSAYTTFAEIESRPLSPVVHGPCFLP